MDNMDSFNDEILMILFSRVPTIDLTSSLQSVCKRWKSIIREPFFRRLHWSHSMSNPMHNQFLLVRYLKKLHFQNLTDETTSIESKSVSRSLGVNIPCVDTLVISDNGLIFICDRALESIFIMNPFTNQCMSLPRPDAISYLYLEACGFVFDPTNYSYKVVIFISAWLPQKKAWHDEQAMLFDSGRKKWRNIIGSIPYIFWDRTSRVLVNGRLHWVADDKILSFDLATEKFSLITPPDPFPYWRSFELNLDRCHHLMVLGGCLCMVFLRYLTKYLYVELWVMKKYGVGNSWVKESDMSCDVPSQMRTRNKHIRVFGATEDGKILVSCDAVFEKDSNALLYELKCQKYEITESKELPIFSWGGNGASRSLHTANLNWVTP